MYQTPYPPQTPMPTGSPSHRKRLPNATVVAAVLAVLLVVFIGGFIWAFGQYDTYKNDAQSKIDEAVEVAKKAQAAESEKTFQAERDRLFYTFQSDTSIANIKLKYPRDWSQYLEQSTSSRTQIEAIFHPGAVAVADPSAYGLRLQLIQRVYDEVVDDYQNDIEKGEIRARSVTSNGVKGLRLEGAIDRDHTDAALVIFPIRDKTLVITTETREYISIFDEAISKLVFTP